MVKEDKLIYGMKAGLWGCLIKEVLTGAMELLKLDPTYIDYGEYLVFRKINLPLGGAIVGFIMEVIFGVFLAVVYTLVKNTLPTNHPLLRGFFSAFQFGF